MNFSSLTQNRMIQDARRAKRLTNWLATILLSVAFLFGALLIALVPSILLFIITGSTSAPADPIGAAIFTSATNIFSFAPIFLMIWIWVRLYEKRPFSTLGFHADRAFSRYARGFLVGALMFALALAFLYLFGALQPAPALKAASGLTAVPAVLIFLLGWLVQGAGEEILCRGWMMPVIGARYTPLTGILVSSAVFAAYHSANPSFSVLAVVNIFLVGIFLSLFCLGDEAIWGVFGWHSAWNWVQGNFFGLNVSGLNDSGASLFRFQIHGPDLVTGGGFGPEGGLAVTAVTVIGIVACGWWLSQRSSRKSADIPV
jgi:membrane protease YdiL (CAAX protease family)